ncbi:hypothetical protein PLESTM_000940800 [Pleodorina starrii]|nr:hypothetical protein PLESTM_000940800 [Pleodorina starrii]
MDNRCDPHKFRYKTLQYHNPRDCRNYTLFDVDARCLIDWAKAKSVCQRKGMELAPQGDKDSIAAVTKLCADNDFTCWLGSECDEPGLCYLMSQEGEVHKQGCKQPVRFAQQCVSAASATRQPAPAAKAHQGISAASATRQPAPAAKAHQGISAATPRQVIILDRGGHLVYDPNILYLTVGDYDYRMYDKSATQQRMSHSRAATFCHGLGEGWNLVPYWDDRRMRTVLYGSCALTTALRAGLIAGTPARIAR